MLRWAGKAPSGEKGEAGPQDSTSIGLLSNAFPASGGDGGSGRPRGKGAIQIRAGRHGKVPS